MTSLYTASSFGTPRSRTAAPSTTSVSAPSAARTARAAPEVEELLERVEKMPAARPAVMRVLQLVDDPDCGAADLANAAGVDIALTGRILKLANSAYYGLSGRIGSLAFAVAVIGFETVRALAVAVASELPSDPALLPPDFWTTSAYTAVAAGTVAGQVGARQPEAFSVGLLADLGAALLFQTSPEAYLALPLAGPGAALMAAEKDVFGITHPQAGRRVLEAWQLPEVLTAVIGTHHDALTPTAEPLQRAFACGHELSRRIMAEHRSESRSPVSLTTLSAGKVDENSAAGLLATVRTNAEPLINCLTAGD
jgi:HD-like signal output (HDOD) protein